MRNALLAILLCCSAGAASAEMPPRAPGDPLPIEYWDEPQDRPPLAAALQVLLGKCPTLANATPLMDKVRPTWSYNPGHIAQLTDLGWQNFVRIEFFAHDREGLLVAVMPGADGFRAQDRVEYWLGTGSHPGILPRDVLAYVLCSQLLPAHLDRLIPVAGLPDLTAPPSAGGD